jgi:hypothetical protein
MNKQLIKQLEKMVGKTYQYGGKIHYVIGVTPDEANDKICIKTNLGSYDRSAEAAPEFLNYWQEATTVTVQTAPTTPENGIVVMERENTMVDKLTDLLMDNITKVQTDATYIKQAQAINNNVNSIINLTKLKLDVMKQTRARKI